MKNVKFSKKSEYVLAGVFAFVAAFPVLVPSPLGIPSDLQAAVATHQQQRALDSKDEYRAQRRDYAKAMALCIHLRATGKDVVCPSVNDYGAIQIFLDNNGDVPVSSSSTSSVASASSVSSVASHSSEASRLQVSDLTTGQTQLLRWYRKINSCPDTLKQSSPDFYTLCKAFLDPHPFIIENRNKSFDASTVKPAATLRQFIDANQGVRRTAK